MACAAKMASLESLNSFFCERLMAVAAELFQVVKATLSDYEEEMERYKQENSQLRRMLTDISSSNSAAESQNVQTEPTSLKEQTSEQAPLDSDASVIQVKVELSTVHPAPEPFQTPSDESAFCTHSDDTQMKETIDVPGTTEFGPGPDSYVSVKLEKGDVDEISSDELNSFPPPSYRNHTCPGRVTEASEESSGPHCSAQGDFQPQNPASETLLLYKVFGRPLGSDGLSRVPHRGRAFLCGVCEKSYSTAHALKIHVRTHTGERPYPCRYCIKTFNQKAHVKEHERIHTGEKPYGCSACGRLFNRTYQVKVHIQNYHPDEEATIIKSQ